MENSIEDILSVIDIIVNLKDGIEYDDIDHLGNRRVQISRRACRKSVQNWSCKNGKSN